jgi:hypothetical protein
MARRNAITRIETVTLQGINLNAAVSEGAWRQAPGTDQRDAFNGVVAGEGVRFSMREILLLACLF